MFESSQEMIRNRGQFQSQCHFSHWGATVTESSTWPCEDVKTISQSHGHVEDSVTVAPLPRCNNAIARVNSQLIVGRRTTKCQLAIRLWLVTKAWS